MPRGSKPGERRGGRKRGTPNRKTELRNAAMTAAAAIPELSPLDFLLCVMRDPNAPLELRIKMAQAAAPFVHPKPGRGNLGQSATNGDGGSDATAHTQNGSQINSRNNGMDSPNPAATEGPTNLNLSPLDFLFGLMRDPNSPIERRLKVAQAAAPFVHSKPGTFDPAAIAPTIDAEDKFAVDPAIARALRDDLQRLDELVRKKYASNGVPLTNADVKEQAEIRARVAEAATSIRCPAGYDTRQARNDRDRLHKLSCKRMSPPSCGGGVLNDEEDAEEAQLMARMEAFKLTPEGRARDRIFELLLRSTRLLDNERSELDSLQKLYPNPVDPDHPLKESIEAWKRGLSSLEE